MHINTSSTKRSWGLKGFIVGTVFGTILTGLGIALIIAALTGSDVRDRFRPAAMGAFIISCGIALYIISLCSLLRVRRWKRRFTAAFMADEATGIYSNRQEAALRLWELSKRCVELSSPSLKLRLIYSRDWLDKYRDELEEFR